MRFSYVAETKRFFVELGLFVVVVGGGTALFLVASQLVGYVPYSDRPGPGWYGWFPVRTWAGLISILGFALGFAAISVTPLAIYGSALVGLARGVARVPWVRPMAFLGYVVLCAYVTMFVTAGVGWLIAIAWPPVVVASALGSIMGIIILRRSLRVVAARNR